MSLEKASKHTSGLRRPVINKQTNHSPETVSYTYEVQGEPNDGITSEQEPFLSGVRPELMPKHATMIMDGNDRCAKIWGIKVRPKVSFVHRHEFQPEAWKKRLYLRRGSVFRLARTSSPRVTFGGRSVVVVIP
ncbi:uncharacterized protein G2W53_036062 [Senna tora]|uniref:Uncharacterized protein n=1 Tax=Senna tora TaxID=362788 RepID=A0A834SST8_9FABA|nr:uncharacterized protein G2W53_036062 [Senna tora]